MLPGRYAGFCASLPVKRTTSARPSSFVDLAALSLTSIPDPISLFANWWMYLDSAGLWIIRVAFPGDAAIAQNGP